MNGDNLVDADLSAFSAFHRREKTDVSILCTEVRDSGRFGLVRTNNDNRVLAFQETYSSAGEGKINGGV